jgi:hypothetical protein
MKPYQTPSKDAIDFQCCWPGREHFDCASERLRVTPLRTNRADRGTPRESVRHVRAMLAAVVTA